MRQNQRRKKAPPGKGDDTTQEDPSTVTPVAIEYENYNFRNLSGDNSCLGEDDAFKWKAIGDLQPGESFTFTPQYPGCDGHSAAVSINLSWEGSELELSSYAPQADGVSWDPNQKGQLIVAPNVANTAQLCMFPFYTTSDTYYTITVTNVGTTTAKNVTADGQSENDWSVFYHHRCLNADADGDGWNDSLEYSMGKLVSPNGYIDGVYQPYILWGSNYLKSGADTLAANDEIDSYPADFNDEWCSRCSRCRCS